jgi:hypothetical protein
LKRILNVSDSFSAVLYVFGPLNRMAIKVMSSKYAYVLAVRYSIPRQLFFSSSTGLARALAFSIH